MEKTMKSMKKDLIFAPILVVIGALLWLLKLTGMTAHITISVVGILVLAAYTFATKKEWKLPALEIATRVCYGLALISGIVAMNVTGIVAVAIAHRVLATLFIVGIVAIFIHKLIKSR